MRTEILAGFYVYGALCCAIIGGAAIAWHDQEAFAAVTLGTAATALSYLTQVNTDRLEDWEMTTVALVGAGWVLPMMAAIKLVFWS